jgi:hypothetical protein
MAAAAISDRDFSPAPRLRKEDAVKTISNSIIGKKKDPLENPSPIAAARTGEWVGTLGVVERGWEHIGGWGGSAGLGEWAARREGFGGGEERVERERVEEEEFGCDDDEEGGEKTGRGCFCEGAGRARRRKRKRRRRTGAR